MVALDPSPKGKTPEILKAKKVRKILVLTKWTSLEDIFTLFFME